MQDDTQEREAQSGLWRHGSKRVRPNDYGLQHTRVTNGQDVPALSDYGLQPTDVRAAPSYTSQSQGIGYIDTGLPQTSVSYGNFSPMGSLRAAQIDPDRTAITPNAPIESSTSFHDTGSTFNSRVRSATTSSLYDNASDNGQYSSPQASIGQQNQIMNPAYQTALEHTQFYGTGGSYGNTPASTRTAPVIPLNGWGDTQYSSMSGLGIAPIRAETTSLYGNDASLHLKLQSLSVLDNLVSSS